MLTLAAAHEQVADLCAPDTDPVLSTDEIDRALVRTAVGATWIANTAYTYGQFIVPTIPQGRLYRCTLAGTSDATIEPTWLMAPRWSPPPSFFSGWLWALSASPFLSSPWMYGLKDGTAAWCDWGAFAGELYNVRAAAYDLWCLKAAKATGDFAFSADGQSAHPEQVAAACMTMARRFSPVGFM